MLRRTLGLIALIVGLLAMPAVGFARSVTFGVHTPNDPFGGDTLKVDALQRDSGRPIGVVSWFQSWGGDPWVSQVQPRVFNAVINGGRTPLLAWEPWQPGGGPSQPSFSLARIAGGAFDAYIARFARGLRDLRAPIYVRPMHEMNGNWYPWGAGVNGNSPALFVQAWRHVVDVVRSQGASNVRWVFTPVNEDWPITSSNQLERYYPGARYVDVLAVDGYNWGSTKPSFGGWRSFSTTFDAAYNRLARLGPQPIWIAEVGSATEGGSKAAWVRDMFQRAQAMDRLDAIVWMDTFNPREGDWRMRYPAGVLNAFGLGDFLSSAAAALLGRSNVDETRGSATVDAATANAGTGDAGTRDAGKRSGGGRDSWKLWVVSRVRVGRRAMVRWNATNAPAGVERWRIYLDDKRVGTLRAGRPPVLRKRMRRAGRYRWTVRGVDAGGNTVISAGRGFRVVRRLRR